MLSTIFAAVSFLLLVSGVVTLSRRRDDYNHIRDTISELGETNCKDSRLAVYGLFLPVAILLYASGAAISSSDQRMAVLAVCIGTGYLVAAIAPCDQGSPMSGSLRQSVHNAGGAIEYFGGALALWNIAQETGPVFFYCGWITAVGTIAISLPQFPWRGLVQRIIETSLFACLIYGCWLST